MSAIPATRDRRFDIVVALGAAVVLTLATLASGRQGWVAMWAIALDLYLIAKWLSLQTDRPLDASNAAMAAYAFAWPGLDAVTFLAPRDAPATPSRSEWLFASAKLLLGAALLVGGIRLAMTTRGLLAGWVGLAAMAFVLHFGLFHMLSCFWRRRGFGAQPIMDWPIRATSLTEFWGRRWNRPFRDATYQFIFRPLIGTFRIGPGSMLAFLFSGVIHEMVITVPAQGGWGRPTFYFLIQGVALQFERSSAGRRIGLGSGWLGWLYAAVVTAVPMGLLFPLPFRDGVIVPFLIALGRGA